MRVYFDEVFKAHETPRGHPENPDRLDAALRGVLDAGAEPQRPGHREDVLDAVRRVHDADYVNYVEGLCGGSGLVELDGDTWVSPSTCSAALAAVAAMLEALEARDNAYILARPPGHHAGFRGRALTAPTQGFCIFNTAAIGALHLGEGVAVVDIDVHHGNGTQEILYDKDLLYISTHQDPATLYPGTGFPHEVGRGRGEGYNVNIPMPPGAGDDAFREAFESVVLPILRQYGPRTIIVSLGWDAHRDDPLADMGLTLNSYKYAIKSLMALQVPLVLLLEGGYNYDVLREGSRMAVELLTKGDADTGEEPSESDYVALARLRRTLEEVRRYHGKYWRL